MLSLSKKMFYAVESVLYIAYNASSSPTSSSELALCQGLPPRYLEPILQRLVRAGILYGRRGPKGGYMLNKDASAIRIADICRAVRDIEAQEEGVKGRTAFSYSVTMPLCESMVDVLDGLLSEVSIASMCETASALNIPKNFDDYAI